MNKKQREALAAYLEERRYEFWHQGGGGCETCGFGGEGEIDWPELVKAIDDFSATFKA